MIKFVLQLAFRKNKFPFNKHDYFGDYLRRYMSHENLLRNIFYTKESPHVAIFYSPLLGDEDVS